MQIMSFRESIRTPLLVIKHWQAPDVVVEAVKVLLPYVAAGAVLLGAA